MPQLAINSTNIGTFSFTLKFDVYNRTAIFNASNTTYNGSGISNVLGISFSLIDSDNVVLATIDFSDSANFILPSVTQSFTVDLSSLNFAFLFQSYQIIGAIKEANGTVYQTTPVYKNVCQPAGINESGYVDGMFTVTPDCSSNILTVSEATLLVYNSQKPTTTTKSGSVYYPTGTINAVAFAGTPFTNNIIYTGQCRISNTTVGEYDLGDDIFVDISYITDNVFDIQCGSKMNDLFCCIEKIQNNAIKNCNNAVGANARQQLLEISTYFMAGLLAEISGKDATVQYDYIKKTLNCDCGTGSIRQNELNPINPSVYSILVVGVNATTVAPTQNGSTKTFTISSSNYVVAKGDSGDLAFTITLDTSVANVVKYKITFDYSVMAGYILTAIGNDDSLIAQLNELITGTTNIDLSNLDGSCIINLSSINYFLSFLTPSASSLFTSITFGSTVHTAPANTLVSSTSAIASYLNGLSLGTFTVSYTNGYLNILSVGNTNNPVSIVLTINSSANTVLFQKTNASLIAVLQAVIDYLCNISALKVALGRNLAICSFDYSGNVVDYYYSATGNTQDDYNAAVASAICNIVNRINTLTAVTCAKVTDLFLDYPLATIGTSDTFLSIVGGNCTKASLKQVGLAVMASINSYQDVKDAFCAIDCTVPASCPEVAGLNIGLIAGGFGLYGLTWATTPTGSQTVYVKYKLHSATSYTTSVSALVILPNGNISGTTPYPITGLSAGNTYDVWVGNNCGGTGFIQQIEIPSSGVYSASFLLDSSIYNICGNSPVTLYSSTPFAVGVAMYTNIGLTVLATGYTLIGSVSSGLVYVLNSTTAVVGASTGIVCNGLAGVYKLGNSTATICAAGSTTLYTNGSFTVGGILYTDSGLSLPQTGYSYVVNTSNNHIYNLNSSTGVIGSDTGLSCTNNTVSVTSSLGGTLITSVVGISGYALGGSVAPGGIDQGTHSAFSGTIAVTITGTPVLSGNVSLYRNGILLQCIAVAAAGTFTFSSQTYIVSDVIEIALNIGACS